MDINGWHSLTGNNKLDSFPMCKPACHVTTPVCEIPGKVKDIVGKMQCEKALTFKNNRMSNCHSK